MQIKLWKIHHSPWSTCSRGASYVSFVCNYSTRNLHFNQKCVSFFGFSYSIALLQISRYSNKDGWQMKWKYVQGNGNLNRANYHLYIIPKRIVTIQFRVKRHSVSTGKKHLIHKMQHYEQYWYSIPHIPLPSVEQPRMNRKSCKNAN